MKKTVSLVEVIVSALILSIVFAGLLTSFVCARTYVKRANKRLVAVNLIRGQLNRLNQEVRQDTWDDSVNGQLCDAASPYNLPNYVIDGITYPGGNNNYTVNPVVGRDCRQVNVEIFYPDN
ncbi:MAG: type II secretion system protein [Candidatus Omnitrophota bacterium]